MAMNGIDIASYQTGINLSVVPCDFVIVKATEGTGYVNPDYTRAYTQAKNAVAPTQPAASGSTLELVVGVM